MIPIAEMGLTYEQVGNYLYRHRCACGAGLVLAWGGFWGKNSYVVRCSADPEHSDFVRPHEATMGNTPDMPGWRLSRKRREEMEKQLGAERARALVKYQGIARLTQEQAAEVVRTFWPKAPDAEVTKAIMLCVQYGLSPLMKHVYILGPFKTQGGGESWAVALGISATRLLAHRQGRYSYLDHTPRRMTNEEQAQIFGEADPTKLWAITKVRDERGNEAPGYGFWPQDVGTGQWARVQGADKGNTPHNMAFKRSEAAALARLFPDAQPMGVKVVDEGYLEVGEQVVDAETGEIIGTETAPLRPEDMIHGGLSRAADVVEKEGEGLPEPEDQPREVHLRSPRVERAPSEPRPKAPTRDPATVKTITDFLRACNVDWGLQPFEAVKLSGYSSQMEINEPPWNCYLKVWYTKGEPVKRRAEEAIKDLQ